MYKGSGRNFRSPEVLGLNLTFIFQQRATCYIRTTYNRKKSSKKCFLKNISEKVIENVLKKVLNKKFLKKCF